jgi:hypothetical protein
MKAIQIIAAMVILTFLVSASTYLIYGQSDEDDEPLVEETASKVNRVTDLSGFNDFYKNKSGDPEGYRSYVYYDEPKRETSSNHVQGYGRYYTEQYGWWDIFTRSTDESTGYLYFISQTIKNETKTPAGRGHHPGGFQICGDYLIVGIESGTDSSIFLYDLKPLAQGKMPGDPKLLFEEKQKTLGVGAMGMTFMGDDYDKLIFAAFTDYRIRLFEYEGSFDYNSFDASKVKELSVTKNTNYNNLFNGRSYQSIQLFCDKNGTLYMLGPFTADVYFLPTLDYYDIIKLYDGPAEKWLDKPAWAVNQKHVVTIHREGENAPHSGVHFRYGSSLQIFDNGDVRIDVCSRNFYHEEFITVNAFRKPGTGDTGD